MSLLPDCSPSQQRSYFAISKERLRSPAAEDNDEPLEHPQQTSTLSFTSYFVTVIIVCTILISIASLYPRVDSGLRPGEKPFNSSTIDCGTSAATAYQRDCRFDLISFSWLPTPCYDQALEQSFLDYDPNTPWKWFLDESGTSELSQQDVVNGSHDFLFVSWEYHLVHCVYMWRKLHRAIEADGWVDSYVGNYNHTLHCGRNLLLDGIGRQEKNTVIHIKYPSCTHR